MKIQVLGSGCPTCMSLYELTQKAVTELGLSNEVEYSTDISKIIEMGVMSSPVLAVDGKPVMVGSTTNIEKIKNLLNLNSSSKKADECCDGCGDDCNCDCDRSDSDCKCS